LVLKLVVHVIEEIAWWGVVVLLGRPVVDGRHPLSRPQEPSAQPPVGADFELVAVLVRPEGLEAGEQGGLGRSSVVGPRRIEDPIVARGSRLLPEPDPEVSDLELETAVGSFRGVGNDRGERVVRSQRCAVTGREHQIAQIARRASFTFQEEGVRRTVDKGSETTRDHETLLARL